MKRIKKIKKLFLNILFPEFGVGCNLEGSLLCKNCASKIVQIREQVCPECLRISQNGKYCKRCSDNKYLNGIIVAAYYEEGPLKEMIHNFKYNHAIGLKPKLAKLMADAIPVMDFSIITFAPLHHRRYAERGYNQAEILAGAVAKLNKLSCDIILTKIRYTKRQVGLTGQKRRENLAGVFRLNSNINIKDQNILIVDDVTTTGATLNECAKVLKDAGAKEVWGLVIARG